MLTCTTNQQLHNFHLNIILNACRRKQYQRVETLLPGILTSAKNNGVIDSRLISVIHDLAGFYVTNNNAHKAKELYKDLLQFNQTSSCIDNWSDDYQFVKVALNQIPAKRSPSVKLAVALRTLLRRYRVPGFSLSAFIDRKKAPAC